MGIFELSSQPPLIQAIFNNDLDNLKEILKTKINVNEYDGEGRTALHAAAYKGDEAIVQELINAGAKVNTKDSKSLTPLHRACAVNADKVVTLLLKHKANPNIQDKFQQTPVVVAAANNSYLSLKALLQTKCFLDNVDATSKTALHYAAINGHSKIVELLLFGYCKKDIKIKKNRNFTALHCAAQMGHTECVNVLIRFKANVNVLDDKKYTPLHVAAASGSEKVCNLLIEAGATIEALNSAGNTPLHVACINGQVNTAQELINSGANPEACNNEGFTPLHVAAASSHGAECMLYLLSLNVDVNKRNLTGKTPLHMTAIYERFTRCKSLIDKGANIDCTDNYGFTPLHIAAMFGHDLLANTLMVYGANPISKGYQGRTPLHVSCLFSQVECCRKFLMANVDLNIQDDMGRTAVHCAAYKGSIECLDLLLSNGANTTILDKLGRLPLHYAVSEMNYECVRTLINNGTSPNSLDNINCSVLHLLAAYDTIGQCFDYVFPKIDNYLSKDDRNFNALHYAVAGENVKILQKILNSSKYEYLNGGITPLHLAARNRRIDSLLLTLLIDKIDNIEIDAVEPTYNLTPLMIASRVGNPVNVKKLLEAGAKINVRDSRKMTPVHYAASKGRIQVLKVLFEHDKESSTLAMLSRDIWQRTAVMLAVDSKCEECGEYLLTMCNKDVIDMVDSDNHSCFIRAYKSRALMEILLSKKAKTDLIDTYGKHVMHLTSQVDRSIGALGPLLEHLSNEEITILDKENFTALHWACYRGMKYNVDSLLKSKKFDKLNMGNVFTPLHCACYSRSLDCMKLLIVFYGKEIVNIRDKRKRTPLHICLIRKFNEGADLLIKSGADVNALDENERSPLIVVAQFSFNRGLNLLLDHDVNLDHQDIYGNTALHWSCFKKDETTAFLLIKRMNKLNVNLGNSDEKTALHIAARNGLAYTTEQLILQGASVFVVDSKGYTPALSCSLNPQVAECLALILRKYKSKDSFNSLNTTEKKNEIDQIQFTVKFKNKRSFDSMIQQNYDTSPSTSSSSSVIDTKRSCLSTTTPSATTSTMKFGKFNKNEIINNEDDLINKNNNSSLFNHLINLKELFYRKKECKQCILWQKRCADCTVRCILRNYLQGKISSREFKDYLMKSIDDTSVEYKTNLFKILEMFGIKKLTEDEKEPSLSSWSLANYIDDLKKELFLTSENSCGSIKHLEMFDEFLTHTKEDIIDFKNLIEENSLTTRNNKEDLTMDDVNIDESIEDYFLPPLKIDIKTKNFINVIPVEFLIEENEKIKKIFMIKKLYFKNDLDFLPFLTDEIFKRSQIKYDFNNQKIKTKKDYSCSIC